MEPSRAAYDLIMRLEVFSNKAYKCRAGVLTIGYGHTGDVKATDVITKSKALDLLAQDVNKLCVPCLKDLKLTQNQYDALCSFIYNVGPTAFNNSTMKKLLTVGLYDEAVEQFDRWTKAKGKTLNDLILRRKVEKRLFLEVE